MRAARRPKDPKKGYAKSWRRYGSFAADISLSAQLLQSSMRVIDETMMLVLPR